MLGCNCSVIRIHHAISRRTTGKETLPPTSWGLNNQSCENKLSIDSLSQDLKVYTVLGSELAVSFNTTRYLHSQFYLLLKIFIIFFSLRGLEVLETGRQWKGTRGTQSFFPPLSNCWILSFFFSFFFSRRRSLCCPARLQPCSSHINPCPAELLEKQEFIWHQQRKDRRKNEGGKNE